MYEIHVRSTTNTAAPPAPGRAGAAPPASAGAAAASEIAARRSRKATESPGVVAEGLGKRYGDLWALRELDLHVPAGSVLGLLGHNGAGKTTAIRILTTLAAPTTGTARVGGHDVVAAPAAVRASIGVAAQDATVDGLLSARANLELIGRLYHLPRAHVRRRADELLERVGLAAEADRLVRTFSGGMRRRIDLAATLVAAPPVLFLDEPTTGLDPASRNDLWELLRELVRDGTTLLLTTQYLEEADRLADQIVVLDHGRAVAGGSPAELKARVGGERIAVSLPNAADLGRAAQALAPFADGPIAQSGGETTAAPVATDAPGDGDEDQGPLVTAPVLAGTRLIEVVRALDAAGVDATDVHRRAATLDDVFLTLTGTGAAA
ncbi:ATP-binding cassette domain-containing protein [Conexibacter stalactiti]|uniref:ATP-binding cassette domain-containing protein n=1 Tax=Conexibacter stalactiti TaxID=1940611 RepID=A0ABU4HHP8_9ACTN|nr:ATP-binding cassette domain-containing protein [Conexibacter stalactiti]MDW5592770.1 ATP-binding cassette domain-containing protein [Conexibacter stalactiti]MEC5033411.1 ATP-binding cassette domain-containing protein [Conexibacter stalactiti]